MLRLWSGRSETSISEDETVTPSSSKFGFVRSTYLVEPVETATCFGCRFGCT